MYNIVISKAGANTSLKHFKKKGSFLASTFLGKQIDIL